MHSVSVVVIDGSDRSSYATFSKTAYLALGGDLDTGMLPITLTLSEAAADAAVAGVSASAPGSASAAIAAVSSTTDKATSARSATSAVSSATSTVASSTKAATTAAPTTTAAPATTTTRDQAAIDAASSSKAWGMSRLRPLPLLPIRNRTLTVFCISSRAEEQQSLQLAAKAASSSEAGEPRQPARAVCELILTVLPTSYSRCLRRFAGRRFASRRFAGRRFASCRFTGRRG